MSNDFETVPIRGMKVGLGYDLVTNTPKLASAVEPLATTSDPASIPDVGFSAVIGSGSQERLSLDAVEVAANVRSMIC